MSSLQVTKVLLRRGDTPDSGAAIDLRGETIQMPPKATMYECAIPIGVVKEVASDTGWAAPRESLKRKRAA